MMLLRNPDSSLSFHLASNTFHLMIGGPVADKPFKLMCCIKHGVPRHLPDISHCGYDSVSD